MAYLVIINATMQKYFNYMYNEPGSGKCLKDYVATRKCMVECIAVSALYRDACDKLKTKQGQLTKSLAKMDYPSEPVCTVRVIEDLVYMDLIVEPALSKTHKRQLAALRTELRVQLIDGRKADGSGSDD